MRFWHSSIVVAVTMDASCALHLSSLLLFSRKLLMDLTLAGRRFLSAFLIMFLAFSDLSVVLSQT